MATRTDSTGRFDLHLQRRTMFSLPDAAGAQIICRSGSVWLTLDGDLRDIVLQAGESFTTAEHRRALVYALSASCIGVLAAVPAKSARHAKPHGLLLEQIST